VAADANAALLELFRDHLSEIQGLCGNDWQDLAGQIRLLLVEFAKAPDPEQSDRLIKEILRLLFATRARDFIGNLIADHEHTKGEITRGSDAPLDDLNFQVEARGAGIETAANLAEWLTDSKDLPYRSVQVHFATDRKATDEDSLNKYFGAARGQLSYGTVRVSVPDRHETGHIERPWAWFPESPTKHVALLDITQSQPGQFVDDLRSTLRSARAKKVLIFVHGYRVSFADAARTIAQMCFDLNFTGIPFLYSWPSQAKFLGYTRDEANAAWTRENFIKTMNTLTELTDSVEQHLLAHSMGNRVVFQGVQFLQGPRFKQIMLAAPDEDTGTFESQMDRFLGHAERHTLYASSKDYALRASRWVHGERRGGEIGVSALDSIDASAVNFSRFGHSYFHDQRALLTDIFLLVEHGHPPGQRPLIRRAPDGNTWLFQP
jgi:esterase/lipase superfamily enzyme